MIFIIGIITFNITIITIIVIIIFWLLLIIIKIKKTRIPPTHCLPGAPWGARAAWQPSGSPHYSGQFQKEPAIQCVSKGDFQLIITDIQVKIELPMYKHYNENDYNCGTNIRNSHYGLFKKSAKLRSKQINRKGQILP